MQAPPPVSAATLTRSALRATWTDRHRLEVYPGTPVSRSPDGSLVAVATNRTNDGSIVERAILKGGHLHWRAAPLPVKMRPGNIVDTLAATGETVYVRVYDIDDPYVFRVRVPGEVAGPTTVLRGRDVDAVERFEHVDATHVGVVGSRGGNGGPDQLVVVNTHGLRWLGPKSAPGYHDFYPTAETEGGNLVDVTSQLSWHYPAVVKPVAYRTGPTDTDTSPVPDPATGTGEDVITTRTLTAPLKTPSSTRNGDPLTDGNADTQVAIYSTSRPARILDVPAPPELDQTCRNASYVVDGRALTVQSVWRGPGGGIWALAGCGQRGFDQVAPRHSWLVRWQIGALGRPQIVNLPARMGAITPTYGRGLVMQDGAMYVPTDIGTLRVAGVGPTRAKATVRAVTRRAGGRVRVQLACVGPIGDLCSGHVRLRDRAGTLAELPFAVDAGTAGMQPYVTREVAIHRALRGAVVATILAPGARPRPPAPVR